jgi:hypothetical protein
MQAPLFEQVSVSAQAMPQAPQASGLLPVPVVHSAGMLPTASQLSPWHVHTPFRHTSPGVQGWPQPLQLSGSVLMLTQVLLLALQAMVPLGHPHFMFEHT